VVFIDFLSFYIVGGILRFEPLVKRSSENLSEYSIAFKIPSLFALSNIGLNSRLQEPAFPSQHCKVCFDSICHWSDVGNTGGSVDKGEEGSTHEFENDSSTDDDEINNKKRQKLNTHSSRGTRLASDSVLIAHAKPIAAFKEDKKDSKNMVTNKRKQVKGRALFGSDDFDDGSDFVTSNHSADGNDTGSTSKQTSDSVADSQKIIDDSDILFQLRANLEASQHETNAVRQELDMVVRKGESRLQEEKRLRREWNEKFRCWEIEKSDLISQIREHRTAIDLLKKECFNILNISGNIQKVLKNISPASNEDNNNASLSSPGYVLRSNPNLFCVVCQSNTADIVFSDCGHICLCYDHYSLMNGTEMDNGGLKKCPLCNTINERVVRVKGIY
jgi:hypothetical protein